MPTIRIASVGKDDCKGMAKLSKRGKRIILNGCFIFIIIIVLVVVAGFYFYHGRVMTDDSAGKNGQISDRYKTPDDVKDKVLNFLVVGIGDDPDMRESQRLTDVIMLVSCDFEAQKINVLQIPRDTYIGNETLTGKMNSIYQNSAKKWDYAGLEGLVQMVNEMFALPVDHYVTIQMDGLESVIDIIGGVEMDVPVTIEVDGVTIEKGRRKLNGEQSLAVVRGRKMYSTGDLGRLDTQKVFLSALVKKCQSLEVNDFLGILPAAMDTVKTDLSVSDAGGYYKILNGFDMDQMNVMTVPGIGMDTAKTKIGRQSVFSVDKQKTAGLLNEYFRPYTDEVAASELKITQLHTQDAEDTGRTKTMDELSGGTSSQQNTNKNN